MNRKILLGVVLVVIVGSIVWLQSLKPKTSVANIVKQTITATSTDASPVAQVKPVTSSMQYLTLAQKAKKYQPGIELAGISTYHNLPLGAKTITLQQLAGKKVILVDFWTYSCINCQRTLPYLTDWYKKYKDQGLEIIGVHTPEFDFEKDPANVEMAIAKYGITYPVVQDNEYGTWNAYSNRYWPHHYLIDIDGYIVDDHIGEGGYAETEMKIQELLAERSNRLNIVADVKKELSRPTVEAAPTYAVSPETYFGSSRNEYLGKLLHLSGGWDIQPEYARSTGEASILYTYQAKHVYFVAKSEKEIVVEVLRDGKPLASEQTGEDVVIGADGKSRVMISEARLYKLINEGSGATGHTLQLIVPSSGLQAFTFTFG